VACEPDGFLPVDQRVARGSSQASQSTPVIFAVLLTCAVVLMFSVAVLQDIENTTGSWDMYGQDSDKRYPGMQNEFFNRAGDVLKRREALRGFVALCK